MECLDANAVQDLMAGALDPSARAQAMSHLDGCADCRDLLALLAKDAARDAAVSTLRETSDPGIRLIETQLSVASASGDPALMATAMPQSAAREPDELDKLKPRRLLAPNLSGRTLDRYTLLERIGVGAMGVVYRADDVGLGRRVALKLLHQPDEALTERLVREARSMAQVNHPHVVAVYDVGVADGMTYIAMELVPGMSLRAWQKAPHKEAEIVQAYIEAGRGLAAAHAAGIVHRDFKPDNCLIGNDGHGQRVKVTDFGLAAARVAEARPVVEAKPRRKARKTGGPPPSEAPAQAKPVRESSLTASGSVLGTPAYMAPEQFTGGNVDPRTDQFNFCVALYEALYGARPFAGKSFDELRAQVCGGRVQPPPGGARVSGALRAIVLRGLSVRPGDRFPTMDHLLAELGRDRATPWRRTAIAAALVGGVLAMGLIADLVVRDRVTAEIAESFALTARQTNRAWDGLTARFDTSANQMYSLSVMREVASNRDQADFGLGSPEDDAKNLEHLHSALTSQDWTLVRDFAGTQYPTTIAIADYKGRMLFSTAAPRSAPTDLTRLPWVRSALTQKDRLITLVRTDDPTLAATGVLGPAPPAGLDFVYMRSLVLGNSQAKEVSSAFLEAVDAAKLFGEIRLDERTRLSIVAPDGTAIGDVPSGLVDKAAHADAMSTESDDGRVFQVLAQPIRGFDNQVVGKVVMARQLDSVLLSLFPGARRMFALAMLVAAVIALIAAWRTRQIVRA
ncbi:MAG TPA: protein kinase [Kofleriaceae bacterium]|nr:protein kinase [Kofleriaceae bacterium]